MKDLPFFPLYAAEVEAETAHLSIEEDGVYNRLLRQMWMQPGCSLPADEKWLCRRLRVTAEQFEQVVKPVIDEFFETRRGRIHSPRLIAEFEKIAETREKRSSAGKKGADARKGLKSQENDPSRASAKNQPSLSNRYSDVEADAETDAETDPHTSGTSGSGDVDDGKIVRLAPKDCDRSEPKEPENAAKYVDGIAPGFATVIDEFNAVWAAWEWRQRDEDEAPGDDIVGKTRAAWCQMRKEASFPAITAALHRYADEHRDDDEDYVKRLRNLLYAKPWEDEPSHPDGDGYPDWDNAQPDRLDRIAATLGMDVP